MCKLYWCWAQSLLQHISLTLRFVSQCTQANTCCSAWQCFHYTASHSFHDRGNTRVRALMWKDTEHTVAARWPLLWEAILSCHVINRKAISFISGRGWSQLQIFCLALLTETVLCQSDDACCDLPPLKYAFKKMNSKFKWSYKWPQWCKKCTPHNCSGHHVYVAPSTPSNVLKVHSGCLTLLM